MGRIPKAPKIKINVEELEPGKIIRYEDKSGNIFVGIIEKFNNGWKHKFVVTKPVIRRIKDKETILRRRKKIPLEKIVRLEDD